MTSHHCGTTMSYLHRYGTTNYHRDTTSHLQVPRLHHHEKLVV
jgi:hypothetical protein